MDNCFSLPNAVELVEMLRVEAEAVQAIEWEIPICTSNHIAIAADVIEQLVEENAKLKEKQCKTGTWIKCRKNYSKCSVCKTAYSHPVNWTPDKYCSECGARLFLEV